MLRASTTSQVPTHITGLSKTDCDFSADKDIKVLNILPKS